jgi:hypothetical protein
VRGEEKERGLSREWGERRWACQGWLVALETVMSERYTILHMAQQSKIEIFQLFPNSPNHLSFLQT